MKIKKEIKNPPFGKKKKKDAAEEDKEEVGGGVEENKIEGVSTMRPCSCHRRNHIMLGLLPLSNPETEKKKQLKKQNPDGIPHSGGESGLMSRNSSYKVATCLQSYRKNNNTL